VSQIEGYCELTGPQRWLIVGGRGRATSHRGIPAARARNAICSSLTQPKMLSRGEAPSGAVIADGYWLPVRDGGADITLSSNVLEHCARPAWP